MNFFHAVTAAGYLAEPPSGIVTAGLVFRVDAGDPASYPGSGTTWFDTVAGFNGTLTNGAMYSPNDGGYISFDDINDIVIFGGSDELTGNDLQAATFTIWFRHASNDIGYMASIKRSSVNSTLLTLHVNTTGSGQLVAGAVGFMTRNYADTAHTSLIDTSQDYRDNEWHSITAVVDGLTRRLYVDGILKNTDSEGMQSVRNNFADFTIGGFAVGGFPLQFYGGKISTSLFYRRALSGSEILQNYNAIKVRYT